MAFATVAAAQTQPAAPAEAQPTTVSDIVVTGSRIRLPDYVAPNPVQSITSEDFDRSGQTNLTNFLTEVPALSGSLTLQDGADTSTPGLAGLNLLNLRNLGTTRTLVLVNGRRHVASNPGTAAVDVNAIPVALVERTEVLTGGASAVYGADGVSGVVNFILKDDFEGIDFRAQTGWSDEGGGENYFGTLVLGQNFNEGRGNVTLALEYNRDEALKFTDRSYTRPGNRFIFIADPDDQTRRILANDVRYTDTSPGGSVYTNFFTSTTESGVTFLGDGSLFQDGIFAGGFTMIGGSGSRLDDFNDDLLPGLERGTVALNARYDLTSNLRAFGELKYTNSESQFTAQPSYVYGLFISEDNPFIPANVLADARTPGGFASTPTGGPVGEAYGLPGAGVLLARDNFDLGRQRYDITRETYRGVVGLEGSLTDNLNFEMSYVYGRAEQEQLASNVLINDRFFAATDVISSGGQPVCRSNIDPTAVPFGDVFGQFAFPERAFGATFTPGANSGCLPLNLFGENQNSQEAIDWVMGEYTSTAQLEQHVVNAFISGDTTGMFQLPAGPIGFVLGAEYRKESSDSRPSDIQLQADALEYPLTGVGRASRTQGSFDVTEAFAEISIPVLRDLPFAQAVDLSAAYRYSDYSTSGGADTWNVNARWAFDSTLAVRGTVARAVRAPNVVNLFQGRQQTFSAFADPCSQQNLTLGENPALRQQNCATDLAALGIDPTTYNNTSSESIGGFIQGNPDLQPETADTYTVGFVATPVDIPGLSFSVDYYNIEISDAIQSYAAQTIVNNCYDLERPNPFCDLIGRASGGTNPGRINSFSQIPGNLASYKTSGWDFNARYRFDPAAFGIEREIGTFEFSAVANLLDRLTFVEVSGATPREDSNLEGAPRFTASFDATWNWRALSVNYGFNYFNDVYRAGRVNRAANPNLFAPEYRKLDARETHDVRVSYNINDGVSVFGGVNNFTNQRPGPGSESYPVNALGRYFFVGARMRLDALSSINPF
ncbi:TonB-dependent siderophore receptor [Brevundimonas sp. S30B]|uniref:TonB-dependent receptor plug domain-containing protein n=1 Tax=Brevundimonas sp. S30B TaxID=2561925 RepID=UPI0014302F68|nr:TonB-dependent receptor [Brevundimonas sp. S30B]